MQKNCLTNRKIYKFKQIDEQQMYIRNEGWVKAPQNNISNESIVICNMKESG